MFYAKFSKGEKNTMSFLLFVRFVGEVDEKNLLMSSQTYLYF